MVERQRGLTELLRRQNDSVERSFDFMRDCRVQNLVNVVKQAVLINVDLLSCLLHHHDSSIFLLEAASLIRNLKKAILIAKLDASRTVWVLDQLLQ